MIFLIPKEQKNIIMGIFSSPPKPEKVSKTELFVFNKIKKPKGGQKHPLYSDEEIEAMKTKLINEIAESRGVSPHVFDRERTIVKFRENGTPYLQPK
jgi:hypothetical protein